MDVHYEKDCDEPFETECLNLTPIQQFYYGKCLFLTGVTGLLGKVILEKVLRSCPGIKKIYLLVRRKKSMTPEERVQKLLLSDIFGRINTETFNVNEKVETVEGDVELRGLGINEKKAKELENNVNIVINSCAQLRTFENIKKSFGVNVIGVKNTLDFCRKIKNLEMFVHLSTFLANRMYDMSVPEKVMKLPMTVKQALDTLSWMDDETAEALKPHLLEWRLSPYLFCKALSEQMIEEQYNDLPITIVRPGIVSAAYKEPFPGCVDSMQGVSMVIYAAAKGIVKCAYATPNMKTYLITSDFVTNTILASAWYATKNIQKGVFVVNCVADSSNELTLQRLADAQTQLVKSFPLANFYRYPQVTVYNNRLAFNIASFYHHYVPAAIADALLFVYTGKTKLLELYDLINKLLDAYVTVTTPIGPFELVNYYAIEKSLSAEDKQLFYMDTKTMDWNVHIVEWTYFMRKCFAKEEPDNIEYAKKKLKIWYFVTTMLQWFIILYFLGYALEIVFPPYFT